MELSKAKNGMYRIGRIILIIAVIICMLFALLSTRQLNRSIDNGNRNIVLNYGNQVAARLHDLFSRVDVSLGALSGDILNVGNETQETMEGELKGYEEIWNMDASGFLYEDGTCVLSDGTSIVFENEISLRDVLSYSQLLNISRQNIKGEDMIVFTKPCTRQVDGKFTIGTFAAMKVEKLEELLGDYGYGNDSFMVLTQASGEIIWKQNNESTGETENCFKQLEEMTTLSVDDSVLQMETRMSVAMDGTVSYERDGQDYYMAYVPLDVNYWYLLVSVRSDSIDLTELARQHYIISTLLVSVALILGAASIIYLIQRNKNMARYNRQLRIATAMAAKANRANQANRAKQEFLAKISHDIRTPLNGVMGMVSLAKEDYDDKDKCIEHLDKASLSANYLLGLLNDVLDMSLIESGKQKLVDEAVDMKELAREIEAIIEVSAGEKGISFQMDDSKLQHQYFHGDKLRIKQILMNLCSNAVKYTQPNGKIILEVGEGDIIDQKQEVYFRVKDNGEGIDGDKLEAIFKPFEQVSTKRQGGVGLGLSIVQSYVDLMAGRISVESKVGEGSTFAVTLPLKTIEEHEEILRAKEEVHLNGINLLLAEDNDINAEITIALLKKRGAEITLVTDGQMAIDEFRDSQPGTYQAILMDIQMPRLDGLEATRQIRALDHPQAKAIPILSMTANAFQEQKDEMIEAGMNDFLYKPIEIDKVCRCISKWVKEGKQHEKSN